MQIFNNIKNSIYSPKYYQELLAKPLSYSLKYYFLFILLLSLAVTIIACFTFIPHAKIFIDTLGTNIVNHYPDELIVTIEKGVVSTNVQEPYFITMPEVFTNVRDVNKHDLNEFKHLLVIDTKNNFSLEQFTNYHTFALLMKDSIVMYNREGAISISPISKDFSTKIDKATFTHYVNVIHPFLKFIYPIMVVGIFLISMVVLSWNLLYLFVGALFVWLVAKVKKVPIGYKKAYQLGIHAVTLGIILCIVIFLTKIEVSIPFLFTIILVIMAAVNIKSSAVVNNTPSASTL